jgi:hypothetical protein
MINIRYRSRIRTCRPHSPGGRAGRASSRNPSGIRSSEHSILSFQTILKMTKR